jgi:hypothetical protein
MTGTVITGYFDTGAPAGARCGERGEAKTAEDLVAIAGIVLLHTPFPERHVDHRGHRLSDGAQVGTGGGVPTQRELQLGKKLGEGAIRTHADLKFVRSIVRHGDVHQRTGGTGAL